MKRMIFLTVLACSGLLLYCQNKKLNDAPPLNLEIKTPFDRKLDANIITLLQTSADKRITVFLKYKGQLSPISQLGFEKSYEADSIAGGTVFLSNIPRIIKHPNVIYMELAAQNQIDSTPKAKN